MRGSVGRQTGLGTAMLLTVAMALVTFQVPSATQDAADSGALTYISGQSVVPVFFGWEGKPDGTFDVHFSYINRNWQEEFDIPIGPNNNIQPAPFGPDGGQPTHFYPRVNRWQFTVRVPKDFGQREIVWTLVSHGQTHRAYGTLEPGFEIDDFLIMYEFNNADSKTAVSDRLRPYPTLDVEGAAQRTVKVGQPHPLIAVATAAPIPQPPPRRGTGIGLRLAWLVYRGQASKVTFDPPIPFKVWEDRRGGSPYAPGWQPPPIPPDNKWVHNVTFREPGTYVLRAQAHDGYRFTNRDLTFTVTP